MSEVFIWFRWNFLWLRARRTHLSSSRGNTFWLHLLLSTSKVVRFQQMRAVISFNYLGVELMAGGRRIVTNSHELPQSATGIFNSIFLLMTFWILTKPKSFQMKIKFLKPFWIVKCFIEVYKTKWEESKKWEAKKINDEISWMNNV